MQAYKPGSVYLENQRTGHLSRLIVANKLKRICRPRMTSSQSNLRMIHATSLQQTGFTTVLASPRHTAGSYPALFTLTSACAKAVLFLWHFP